MKYFVISYDDDQQQTFFDFVEASTPDVACYIAGEQREYAIPCQALTSSELRIYADLLDSTPEEHHEHQPA